MCSSPTWKAADLISSPGAGTTGCARSTGCARCGDCCNPVVLSFDVFTEIGQYARVAEDLGPNYRFIPQHWHPISAYTDENGEVWLRLRCDVFDPDTLTCTAYEDRPPVCSDFPWYGQEPDSVRALHDRCSYWFDIPAADRPARARPLIPLEVL